MHEESLKIYQGNLIEGDWRSEENTDYLYPLKVPNTGHNLSLSAKGLRESFKDYFMNEGAV